MLKRILYIGPIVILVLFGVLVGSFWLVPTDRLNAIIARQLTDALGSNVTFSGRPSVSIIPFLKVSFGPIKVASSGDDAKPLMEIARASGRLSTTSLWEGKPALRYIDLEDANIFLIRDEAGKTNWSAVRFFSTYNETQADGPDLKFSKILKRITFINSTLNISDPSLKERHKFTELNAVIIGPPRSADFSARGSFIWNGALVEGSASIEKPGTFMVGGTSPAILSISSAATDATFRGDLTWAKELRGDGYLEADVHSAYELSRWLNLAGGDILPDKPMRLIGDGIFTPTKFDFRPIGIRFQDGKADGRLELDLTGGALGLSGTLAFDRFNFDDSETPSDRAPSFIESLLATGQSGAKLDMRISADSARIAGHNIQNMAVGIILNQPSLMVNIGSADMMSAIDEDESVGQLRGEIIVEFADQKKTATANVTLNNMTVDALEETMGKALPFDGDASISLQVAAGGKSAVELEDSLSLEVVADIQNGALNYINLSEIFTKDQAPDGTALNNEKSKTPFEQGKITGTINSSGIFTISQMTLAGEEIQATSSGRVDIANDQVSMLGRLSSVGSNAPAQTSDVPFTLGGMISSPRVSSVNGVPVPTSNAAQ